MASDSGNSYQTEIPFGQGVKVFCAMDWITTVAVLDDGRICAEDTDQPSGKPPLKMACGVQIAGSRGGSNRVGH